MPPTTHKRRRKQSVEAQPALVERVLRDARRQIDEDLDQVCQLECEHAFALYKIGRNPVVDGDESLREARSRIG